MDPDLSEWILGTKGIFSIWICLISERLALAAGARVCLLQPHDHAHNGFVQNGKEIFLTAGARVCLLQPHDHAYNGLVQNGEEIVLTAGARVCLLQPHDHAYNGLYQDGRAMVLGWRVFETFRGKNNARLLDHGLAAGLPIYVSFMWFRIVLFNLTYPDPGSRYYFSSTNGN